QGAIALALHEGEELEAVHPEVQLVAPRRPVGGELAGQGGRRVAEIVLAVFRRRRGLRLVIEVEARLVENGEERAVLGGQRALVPALLDLVQDRGAAEAPAFPEKD